MTIGLPVTRLISVSVTLTPQAANYANLQTLLIVGDTPGVIDTHERLRAYGSIPEVAGDFGTAAPEYLAALEYFSQNPAPTELFIGFWAKAATEGRLVGGVLSGPQQVMANWTVITAGAFSTYVDGVPITVSGLNFSALTNLSAVASAIQTAFLSAGAPGGSTVVWDPTNFRFVFTSGVTGTTSTVSFLTAPTAFDSAVFSGQPTANDTLTVDGTAVTFVASGATGNQVNIAGTLPLTLAALQTLLANSVDANIAKSTYSIVGSTLWMVSKVTGTAGNAYTLAKSSTAITLGGATFSGGSGTDISAQLLGTASTASWSVAGVAAESAVAAVTAMDNLTTQFYCLSFAAGTNNQDVADSDNLAVAAYCEASVAGGQPHVFGVTTGENSALVAGNATDIGSELMASGYFRTFASYSSANQYLNASVFGRMLTVNYQGQNTTLTAMWKQMPGVTPEELTYTYANTLDAKRYNYVAEFNNNTSILVGGRMAGPCFIDDTINLDNFASELTTDLYNLLYTTPTKIPQTDSGMDRFKTTIGGTCSRFVTNATFAPGQWNSDGFGTLNPGDQLPAGYYIFAPPVATQPEAIRAQRISVTFQVAAKLAGAVHYAVVSVVVNQ